MEILTGWKAHRSGAHMTLTVTGEDGETRKITHIVEIEQGTPGPVALAEDGTRYLLK